MSSSSTVPAQNEQDLPEIAFPLPGGGALRYWFSRPGFSYKTAYYTYWSDGLLRRSNEKKWSPKIAGWNKNIREQLCIADFDKPEKLPPAYPTFDSLYEYLKATYSGSGIIVRTFSGKVKLIFVIRLSDQYSLDEYPMNTETAHRFLKERLGEELFNAIDLNPSAQHTLGLTPEIVEALRRQLPVIPVIPLNRSIVVGAPENTGINCIPIKQRRLIKYEEPLETLDPAIRRAVGRSKPRESVLRWLLCSRALISEEGFPMSQLWVAEQLGFSQGAICKALMHFQKHGLLKVIDHSFKWGNEAHGKRYIAIGALAAEIKHLAPNRKEPEPFPDFIPNQEWDQTLYGLLVSGWYLYPKQYLENVRQLPGSRLKPGRLDKALRRLNEYRKEKSLEGYGLPSSLKDSA